MSSVIPTLIRDEVNVYNMRYRDSVEDRVHELLSDRLEGIYNLFGQKYSDITLDG